MPTDAPIQRMAVISPHLDDAVFSCGEWLSACPGSVVVTLFAGAPPRGDERNVTEWDRRCGFADGAQAIAARRDEDRQALAGLEARPVWGPFLDAQYGGAETPASLVPWLAAALAGCEAEVVLFPLGLFHADHRRASDAAREVLAAQPALRSYAYEDALYRGIAGELQRRLTALAGEGVEATPARLPTVPDRPRHADRKRQAVLAYASQLRAFGEGGAEDLREPERLWRLRPAANLR